MTDWTARINALLADEPDPEDYEYKHQEGFYEWDYQEWLEACLALAAERLREPHDPECNFRLARVPDYIRNRECTCGKDSDLLRILEGK